MTQQHANRPASERANLYQQITDRIIAELEAGRVPWVQPWDSARTGIGMPHNAVSDRKYSGIIFSRSGMPWCRAAIRATPS